MGPTLKPERNKIEPKLPTVTPALLLVKPDELAVIVVEPTPAPVIVKVAAVLPAETVTLAGIVRIALGDCETPTVMPPVGAGALRVMVPLID